MGFPQGDDLVQGTNPYYRTAYALVAKPGNGLDDVTTLEDERLKGKHIGIVAGTPPATNMAVAGLMANAKPYPLMIDTRVDSSAAAMIDDLMSGRDRRRHPVGADGGLLRQEGEPAAPCHAARQGNDRTAARLSHRHGRAQRRSELEAAAQPADPGEPAGDQQDPARLRRSLARREATSRSRRRRRPSRHDREAGGPRPCDLRMGRPSPRTGQSARTRGIPHGRLPRAGPRDACRRARTLTNEAAETIWRAKAGVFIDVLPRPPKPPNLPAGTVWRDKPRLNIPGSVWLPDTGYGKLAAATEDYFRAGSRPRLRRQQRNACS